MAHWGHRMELLRPSCASISLLLLCLFQLTQCMNAKINFREKEKQILDQILGPGRYDARIRPSGINGTGILSTINFPRAMAGRAAEIQQLRREIKIPNLDRSQSGMDARLVLFQREGGSLPQHHHAECVHQDISERQRAVQHSDFSDVVLPYEPQTLSLGQADMLTENGKLWLDNRRPGLPLEGRGPSSGGKELAPAPIHPREVPHRLLQQQDQHRRVQLLEGGFALQKRVQLLPHPDLHTLLHVGDRLLGVILARSRCCARESITRRDYPSNYGHTVFRNKRVTAPSVLHKSNRCMDRSVPYVRIRSITRVRTSELCLPLRHASGEYEEDEERDGGCRTAGRGLRPPRYRQQRYLRNETAGARWRDGREDATVRDPHQPAAEELLPAVDVQVPHAQQAHRRYLQDHLPPSLRSLQPRLLAGATLRRMKRSGIFVARYLKQFVSLDRLLWIIRVHVFVPGRGRREINQQKEEADHEQTLMFYGKSLLCLNGKYS